MFSPGYNPLIDLGHSRKSTPYIQYSQFYFFINFIFYASTICMPTVLSPCHAICTNMSPYFIPHRISYLLYCNPSILLFPRMSPLSLFLFSVHTHWNSSLFLLIFPFNTFFKYFPNSFFAFHSFLFLHFLLYFWPSLF